MMPLFPRRQLGRIILYSCCSDSSVLSRRAFWLWDPALWLQGKAPIKFINISGEELCEHGQTSYTARPIMYNATNSTATCYLSSNHSILIDPVQYSSSGSTYTCPSIQGEDRDDPVCAKTFQKCSISPASPVFAVSVAEQVTQATLKLKKNSRPSQDTGSTPPEKTRRQLELLCKPFHPL